MELKQADVAYSENPDYYDGFFVPERARWGYLQTRLNDATESYGGVLNKALSALNEANNTLEHVFDHPQHCRDSTVTAHWKRLTPYHVAAKMGIPSSLARAWESGKSRPGDEQWQRLRNTLT